LSDCPDEAGELTSHSAERALPSDPAAEMAVLVMESLLAALADLADLRRDADLTLLKWPTNRRLEASVMGGLAKDVTEQAVARLGEMSTPT
jgi:hypothetical protein